MGWTKSSMSTAYNENEEEETMNSTLFGQIMHAINTFRDIAYVLWAAGWNRK